MLARIFSTFANCFKIPELKSRIIFTLLILCVCRLVSMIPIPGLDGAALSAFFDELAKKQEGAGLLGMYSMFTGGALEKCGIGSLGIMPYISATIIIQLMSAVVPALSKLAREEGGRVKIIQYGRYLTVLLCLGQGFVMSIAWENPEKIFQGFQGQLVLGEAIWWYRIQTTIMLTTGTLLLMWLGEQITDRGIGNGISLVITIGILAQLPKACQAMYEWALPPEGVETSFNLFYGIGLIGLLVGVTAATIAVTQAQRKIPVQYAQRQIGRKMVQGSSSFMPLRVNYAGVMPIIFAQALLMFPEKVFDMLGKALELKFLEDAAVLFRQGSLAYVLTYAAMIIFFTYFYTAIVMDPNSIADNMKKHGGFIPGIRPGPRTAQYIDGIMTRITLPGSIALAAVAIFPFFVIRQFNVHPSMAQFFGGTGLLIIVGVALDTLQQIESQLMTRHYEGFMKKGRIQGRRG